MESRTLTLIKNLNTAAKCHKEHCQDSNCGISLYMIKEAAKLLSDYLNDTEMVEFIHMEWPS